MSVNCIDVSSYQGVINWSKVKSSGVKYAILRSVTKDLKTDTSFEYNYKNAKASGLQVGVYLYSYATNASYAKKEANALIKLLNGRKLDLPVFYDLESSYLVKASKSTVQSITKAFKTIVETAGYSFGIYCGESFCNTNFSGFDSGCGFWIAHYGKNDGVQHRIPEISHHLCGHQFSSKGKISGISGYVDISNWYGVKKETVKQDANVTLNKTSKWVGYVTANQLNVRTWAGVENKTVSFSPLPNDTKVDICDTVKTEDGKYWYYIKYKDKYGFVSSTYISHTQKKEESVINYLSVSSKWMKTIYDKVVSLACVHKSSAKTYDEMITKKATTCGRTASFVLQKVGILKSGELISHTDAIGGTASKILKNKNTIAKSMTGYSNLDLKKCDVVYIGAKNFKSVPDKYKVSGVVFIQDSNVFMCAGKVNGKMTNRTCNNDTKKQVKKDSKGVYRYYNNTMTTGYTFSSPILVAIIPKSK